MVSPAATALLVGPLPLSHQRILPTFLSQREREKDSYTDMHRHECTFMYIICIYAYLYVRLYINLNPGIIIYN